MRGGVTSTQVRRRKKLNGYRNFSEHFNARRRAGRLADGTKRIFPLPLGLSGRDTRQPFGITTVVYPDNGRESASDQISCNPYRCTHNICCQRPTQSRQVTAHRRAARHAACRAALRAERRRAQHVAQHSSTVTQCCTQVRALEHPPVASAAEP